MGRKAGIAVLWLLLAALLLTGCGGEEKPRTQRQTRKTILIPQCVQEVVYGSSSASVDASRSEDGYILVRYTGGKEKIKVQITIPDGTVYTYALPVGEYETLPLTGGSGTYGISVLENAYDDFYSLVFSQEIQVQIRDELEPFLYPNQYVWYTADDQVIRLGVELSDRSGSDLEFVEQVYNYIIETIDYDYELAADVPLGYLPDLNRILETKKGICFDFASLMTALLRTQGIPARLVVGYSGLQYHAWIDVYLEDMGWVSNAVYFDGEGWSLMDPTLGATNNSSDVRRYVENEENYLAKYLY